MALDTPILDGPRLRLRPVTADDVTPRYLGWLRDEEVVQYLESRFHEQTMESVLAYVENLRNDPAQHFWAVTRRDDGLHLGNVRLGPVEAEHCRAEVAFIIGERSVWGRGLATEAVGLAVRYGLEGLGLHKVTGGCYSLNKGSARIFEKLGFVLEATLKEQYRCQEQWADRLCYACFSLREPVD